MHGSPLTAGSPRRLTTRRAWLLFSAAALASVLAVAPAAQEGAPSGPRVPPIRALYVTGGSTATVVHSTIAGNTATAGSSVTVAGGTMRLRGTIVADTCAIGGTMTSEGHNLLDAPAGCGLTDPTDRLDAAPGLGALGDHGGPLGADRARRVAEVGAQLGVGERVPGG